MLAPASICTHVYYYRALSHCRILRLVSARSPIHSRCIAATLCPLSSSRRAIPTKLYLMPISAGMLIVRVFPWTLISSGRRGLWSVARQIHNILQAPGYNEYREKPHLFQGLGYAQCHQLTAAETLSSLHYCSSATVITRKGRINRSIWAFPKPCSSNH